MTLLLLAYNTIFYISYNSPRSEMSVVGRKKRFREISLNFLPERKGRRHISPTGQS